MNVSRCMVMSNSTSGSITSRCQTLFDPFARNLNTLPETKISPENRPLEKEIPIGNHHF